MPKLSFYVVLYCLCAGLQSSAQQLSYPYHIIGSELRADNNSRIEFSYRYLKSELGAFGVKLAKYSYEEDIPGIAFTTNIPSVDVSHTYLINGVSMKLGWIMGNKIRKHTLVSSSLYVVGARNLHEYSQTFTDANGSQTDYYSRLDYTWGGEFELYTGLRLGDNFIMYGTFVAGLKPGVSYLFDDVVEGLPSYKHYAPNQGYGSSGFYLSASFGLSFML